MTMTLASGKSKSSMAACDTCAVRNRCLAAGVDKAKLPEFQNTRDQMRVVHKGEHLFRTDDEFDALYVVRSGTVKATFINDDGSEQVSGFYLPGEMLGLDGIINDRYATNAIALETTSVCVYSFDQLLAMAREQPGLQRQLWQFASREITSRQRLLTSIGHRSAEGRVAEFLLSLSKRFSDIGYSGTRFRLPMSRQDIGDYLGLSVETVCRVLTRFQNLDVITREQREIQLRNIDELQSLSFHNPDSDNKAGNKSANRNSYAHGHAGHAMAAG